MNRKLRQIVIGEFGLDILDTFASKEVREGALCNEAVSELFFSEEQKDIASARQICMQCPVRAKCLQYGIEYQNDGVLGGYTASERKKMARGGQLDISMVNQAVAMRRDLFRLSIAEFAKKYDLHPRTVLRLRKDSGDVGVAA